MLTLPQYANSADVIYGIATDTLSNMVGSVWAQAYPQSGNQLTLAFTRNGNQFDFQPVTPDYKFEAWTAVPVDPMFNLAAGDANVAIEFPFWGALFADLTGSEPVVFEFAGYSGPSPQQLYGQDVIVVDLKDDAPLIIGAGSSLYTGACSNPLPAILAQLKTAYPSFYSYLGIYEAVLQLNNANVSVVQPSIPSDYVDSCNVLVQAFTEWMIQNYTGINLASIPYQQTGSSDIVPFISKSVTSAVVAPGTTTGGIEASATLVLACNAQDQIETILSGLTSPYSSASDAGALFSVNTVVSNGAASSDLEIQPSVQSWDAIMCISPTIMAQAITAAFQESSAYSQLKAGVQVGSGSGEEWDVNTAGSEDPNFETCDPVPPILDAIGPGVIASAGWTNRSHLSGYVTVVTMTDLMSFQMEWRLGNEDYNLLMTLRHYVTGEAQYDSSSAANTFFYTGPGSVEAYAQAQLALSLPENGLEIGLDVINKVKTPFTSPESKGSGSGWSDLNNIISDCFKDWMSDISLTSFVNPGQLVFVGPAGCTVSQALLDNQFRVNLELSIPQDIAFPTGTWIAAKR